VKVYKQTTRAARTFHDGVLVFGMATARCAVVSVRRLDWKVAPSNMTTNCKRCLAIRNKQK
jgi:hypothetical protein